MCCCSRATGQINYDPYPERQNATYFYKHVLIFDSILGQNVYLASQ